MDKYVIIRTVLQQGEHTFQVKADEDGLILDVFQHVGEMELEHIESKSIFYDEIGLEPICESDQKVKDKQIGKRVMTLQEKAVEMSNRRTELSGEHNTKWMPLSVEKLVENDSNNDFFKDAGGFINKEK